jgi:hypothetical protein
LGRVLLRSVLSMLALCLLATAQAALPQLMERLDQLEQRNRQLEGELAALRAELQKLQQAELADRVEVQERRTEDLAQTKVETSSRYPVRLTGSVLVNLFRNSRHGGGADTPTSASLAAAPVGAGATLRQSILGLAFDGPAPGAAKALWGARASGHIEFDFFNGNTETVLNSTARLRTASLQLDWQRRSIMMGQEKPIFNPREPASLSYAGISPLTGAGNLWRWQPQVRYEEKLLHKDGAELLAQAGVMQTNEDSAAGLPVGSQRRRPGYQGRLLAMRRFAEGTSLEVASGFHASSTHLLGQSVASRVYSVDWNLALANRFELTGFYYRGQNVAHFGALRQGFQIFSPRNIIPVRSQGGWAQATWKFSPTLSFNAIQGVMDDHNRDLIAGQIARNQSRIFNFLYRLGPNVLLGAEFMQLRTRYLPGTNRHNNRYDLSLAYLF